MAIGWLSVLQLVPWSDVISNAPKVVDGAKKLWNSVGKKPPAPELVSDVEALRLSPDAQAIATLQARATAMDAALAELHHQMLASSELIKTLADQNAQLIQRIELNRVRLLVLAGVTMLVAVAAALGLGLTLFR